MIGKLDIERLGPTLWGAAQRAARLMEQSETDAVLVGTAAITLHEVTHGGPPADLDFLVKSIPENHLELDIYPATSTCKYGLGCDVYTYNFADNPTRVNFIQHHDDGSKFFCEEEGSGEHLGPYIIGSIRVACLACALGLKRWSSRPKDISFFQANPRLALIADRAMRGVGLTPQPWPPPVGQGV